MPRAPASTPSKCAYVFGAAGGILIRFASLAVHRLLSGPVVIAWGVPICVIVVGTPTVGLLGSTLTTWLVPVTHRLPSGPVVMPTGLARFDVAYSVTAPAGVTLASLTLSSTTQMFPSGPRVRCFGPPLSVPTVGNSPLIAGAADAVAGARASRTRRAGSRRRMNSFRAIGLGSLSAVGGYRYLKLKLFTRQPPFSLVSPTLPFFPPL